MTFHGILSPFIKKYHVTLTRTKAVTYSSQMIVQLSFFQLTCFFQLKATYLDESWPKTLLQPRTSKLALTMWTLASVKADLDNFLGQKVNPTIWILHWKCSIGKERCRMLTETKLYNRRSWFQSVSLTKKSISCCSLQLCRRPNFVASSSIYRVQKHGGAIETCSQGDW